MAPRTKNYLALLEGMREIERILKERMHEEEESIVQNGVPLLVESMADQIDELKEELAEAKAHSPDGGLREALVKAAYYWRDWCETRTVENIPDTSERRLAEAIDAERKAALDASAGPEEKT